jgi:predicted DsbA family dithiol-disulfide isomerase
LAVVSDVICPWCYIGKRRFEAAIKAVAPDGIDASLTWLPFALNPDMPIEGVPRAEYRLRKFGSAERVREMDAHVTAQAAGEGLEFHLDRIIRTPNTEAAHRLIWLAGRAGGPALQDAVVERLFAAYFTEGQDIGDEAVLARLGEAAGLDAAARLLADPAAAQAVAAGLDWAGQVGLSGVPSVIGGNMLLFSGAQPSDQVAATLRALAAHLAANGATRPGEAAA